MSIQVKVYDSAITRVWSGCPRTASPFQCRGFTIAGLPMARKVIFTALSASRTTTSSTRRIHGNSRPALHVVGLRRNTRRRRAILGGSGRWAGSRASELMPAAASELTPKMTVTGQMTPHVSAISTKASSLPSGWRAALTTVGKDAKLHDPHRHSRQSFEERAERTSASPDLSTARRRQEEQRPDIRGTL